MSEDSLTDSIANEKLSDDSCNDNGGKRLFKTGDGSNKQNIQITCHARSDTLSSSSQNDDKSDHYARLLKQSQQTVSNRDILIGMLQRQLKKMEELYKKTLDQQQEIRMKYFNVVQELAHQNLICNKLKKEVFNLGDVENIYFQEKKALQMEVEKWKKEYDQLIKATNGIEKKPDITNHIAEDKRGDKKSELQHSAKVEEILEHYRHIKEALSGQNEKLDKLLGSFQVIGDGGCTIIKSLEGIKCINEELSKSLSSLVAKQANQTPNSHAQLKRQDISDIKNMPSSQMKAAAVDTQECDVLGDAECNICKEIIGRKQLLQQRKLCQTESVYSDNCCKESLNQRSTGTIDGCYSESVCSCSCCSPNNSIANIYSKTNEKSSNTECECCLSSIHEVEDAFRENQKLQERLEHTAEEIKELKQLIVNQSEASLVSHRQGDEGNIKMKEENEYLKLLVGKLEDDVKKLTADCGCSNKELTKAQEARVETLKQSDRLLEKYETSLEEINERYSNTVTELDILKNQNKTLREKITLLEETLERYKEESGVREQELDEANTKATFLEASLREIEGVNNEKENHQSEELSKAQAENSKITEKYNELRRNYDILSEKNEEMELFKKKNEHLARELDARDVLIYDLGEQVNNLENDLNSMRDEMSENNDIASREMNVLLTACVELGSKLEITKEILIEDNNTEDVETNTVNNSLTEYMSNTDVEELKASLDEKDDEMQGLLEELKYSKTNYEKELKILRNKIEILQGQLERERDEHRQDLQLVQEKLEEVEHHTVANSKNKNDTVTETNEYIGFSNNISSTSELSSFFEETEEQNLNLRKQLKLAKLESKKLKGKIKEFGVLKAENSNLKEKIVTFQKLLSDMKDLEENLKKSQKDKEEMSATVQCLEIRLNALQSTSGDQINAEKRNPSHTVQILDRKSAALATEIPRRSIIKKNEETYACDDKSCQWKISEEKSITIAPTVSKRTCTKINNNINNYEARCSCSNKSYQLRIAEEKALAIKSTIPTRNTRIKNYCNNPELPCACGDKSYLYRIPGERTFAIEPITKPKKTVAKIDKTNNNYDRLCACDDERYQMKTRVKITYKDKKSKTADKNKERWFNLATFGTINAGNNLKNVQMRLTHTNRLENQLSDLTLRDENRRLHISNIVQREEDRQKDMQFRLHQLQHKREELSKSFNHFQKEVQCEGTVILKLHNV